MFLVPGIELRFLGCPTRNLTTMPTEVFRLPGLSRFRFTLYTGRLLACSVRTKLVLSTRELTTYFHERCGPTPWLRNAVGFMHAA